jgi:hypothetical protein
MDIPWGDSEEYKRVDILLKDHGKPTKGDLNLYKELASNHNKSIINAQHPGDGQSYGTSQKKLRSDANDFYLNHLLNVSRQITYDNILILHGNSPSCWAHNAEGGSMSAFGKIK